MNDGKKAVVAEKQVEKHYERRWLEAKSEMLKDAGPVIDFFINMHQSCSTVAAKHRVSTAKLTGWVLEQLPIHDVCDGDEEDDTDDDDDDTEVED